MGFVARVSRTTTAPYRRLKMGAHQSLGKARSPDRREKTRVFRQTQRPAAPIHPRAQLSRLPSQGIPTQCACGGGCPRCSRSFQAAGPLAQPSASSNPAISKLAPPASRSLRLQRQPAPPASRPPHRRAIVPMRPPTVSFLLPVAFGTSLNRVPPGVGVRVPVIAAGIPPGRTVALDIQGAGGGPGGFNGTATVRPSRIAGGTSWVTVTGGAQTPPNRANRLKLRASFGGRTLATSSGFTVAAHPRNFSVSFHADINTPNWVGLHSTNAWASDGARGVADLSEVECAQQVDILSRDDPPFTSASTTMKYKSGLGGLGLIGSPGVIPGLASPIVDTLRYPISRIDAPLSGVTGTTYKIVYKQLFVFDDHRTGLQGQTVPSSGFTITHTLTWNASRNQGQGGWDHQCVKTGAIVQLFGFLAMPGAGTATSFVHPP